MDKILVDTSIWVDFLRHPHVPTGRTLRGLLDQDAVVMTGVVLAELLHGSQTEQEAELLLTRLQPLAFLETTRDVWVIAGRLSFQLRRQGLSLPFSDYMVAAVAQAHECSIYTTDTHFARIPHLKLYHPT